MTIRIHGRAIKNSTTHVIIVRDTAHPEQGVNGVTQVLQFDRFHDAASRMRFELDREPVKQGRIQVELQSVLPS